MADPTVRTRFAPSPTGYMHIGGMRTALFNWLWARHNGGQFILRIDDTDQQRNIDAALAPILAAFRWLGLDWDEGPEVGGPHKPYFQSQRSGLYEAAAQRLLDEGLAYRDYDPPELTRADREEAEKAKQSFVGLRRSLDLSDAERQQYEDEQRPYVVRFLVPRDERVTIDDHIRGRVEWDCSLIPDPVIQRGDGSPLYNFATVVDDAAMQITHVIRAEEHLSNTPVQVLLAQALEHAVPAFAHIPFVAAPGTKEKISKRDKKIEKYRKMPQFKKLFDMGDDVFTKLRIDEGDAASESAVSETEVVLNPVMVEWYEQIGFLPEAILNGLARLGWSFDDKTENMSREFVVENFTLDRVVKAPAGLDPDKLLAFQEHWIGQLSSEEKVEQCLPYLIRAKYITEPVFDDTRVFVTELVEALGDRLKLFSDVLHYEEYFVTDNLMTYDEKAFEKRVRKPDDAVPLLREFREALVNADDFDAESLDALMHEFVAQREIGMGRIIHAVRMATTGKPTGPGMFDCLALLGKERCLARIDRTLGEVERS